MSKLESFLEIADVPVMRKDLSNSSNVKWLKYNLWIRNSVLPGYKDAEEELLQLFEKTFNIKRNK